MRLFVVFLFILMNLYINAESSEYSQNSSVSYEQSHQEGNSSYELDNFLSRFSISLTYLPLWDDSGTDPSISVRSFIDSWNQKNKKVFSSDEPNDFFTFLSSSFDSCDNELLLSLLLKNDFYFNKRWDKIISNFNLRDLGISAHDAGRDRVLRIVLYIASAFSLKCHHRPFFKGYYQLEIPFTNSSDFINRDNCYDYNSTKKVFESICGSLTSSEIKSDFYYYVNNINTNFECCSVFFKGLMEIENQLSNDCPSGHKVQEALNEFFLFLYGNFQLRDELPKALPRDDYPVQSAPPPLLEDSLVKSEDSLLLLEMDKSNLEKISYSSYSGRHYSSFDEDYP